MIFLGVVELAQRCDLGGDAAETGLVQRLLVVGHALLDDGALVIAGVIDRATVLVADVIALTHALGGVMGLEAGPQDLRQADHRRVKDHAYDLGVACLAGAGLFIARIRRMAAGIADRRHLDARQLPEEALGSPEAAQPQHDLLTLTVERRYNRAAIDVMNAADANRFTAPWQAVLR